MDVGEIPAGISSRGILTIGIVVMTRELGRVGMATEEATSVRSATEISG